MPFGRWKPRGQNGSGILKAMVDTIPISGIKKLSVSEKKRHGLDCIEAPSFQASCVFFKPRTMERNGWLCHLLLVWTIENKANTAPWDADFYLPMFCIAKSCSKHCLQLLVNISCNYRIIHVITSCKISRKISLDRR